MSVRDTLSEYHSILMTPKETDPNADEAAKAKLKEKTEADRRQLSYLGTKLDLLLNQKKDLQRALWQVSDDILKKADARPLTEEELNAVDKQLVAAARNVLDFHWQKIKAEILGMPKVTEPSTHDRRRSSGSQSRFFLKTNYLRRNAQLRRSRAVLRSPDAAQRGAKSAWCAADPGSKPQIGVR
jgi:hypothetical protein